MQFSSESDFNPIPLQSVMTTELGLLSLTPLQKLTQPQEKLAATTPNEGGGWMWYSNQQSKSGNQNSDDSWEVQAFEQDTNNAMGTTWPPRSYTCTFCRREFRSAQALGGHTNVHRRDRARLHQTPPLTTSTATVIVNPTYHQELVANGGVCLIYSLPNPNAIFSPSTVKHCIESSYSASNLMPRIFPPTSINFPVAHSVNSSLGHSSITEHSTINDDFNEDCHIHKKGYCGKIDKEIDLELRLGCGSSGIC